MSSNAGLLYHELRYEDLEAEPEATFRKVLEFLKVSTARDVVEGCLSAGDFATLSGGRAPGEEDPTSFFRKGRSGDWKSYLSDRQVAEFRAASDDLTVELGYEDA